MSESNLPPPDLPPESEEMLRQRIARLEQMAENETIEAIRDELLRVIKKLKGWLKPG